MKQEAIRLEQQSNQLEAGFGYRFGRQLKGEFASLSKDMKQFEARVANKIGSAKMAKFIFLASKVIFVVAIALISFPLAAAAGFLMALLYLAVKLVDSGLPEIVIDSYEERREVQEGEDFFSRYAAASQDLYWLEDQNWLDEK